MATYVIRADDIDLLNHLPAERPKPVASEWINRGTDQRLRPTTVHMLLRTLHLNSRHSDSVERLRRSAGLRMHFQSWEEQNRFAALFRKLQLQKANDVRASDRSSDLNLSPAALCQF